MMDMVPLPPDHVALISGKTDNSQDHDDRQRL
jgi:hypothetical protein